MRRIEKDLHQKETTMSRRLPAQIDDREALRYATRLHLEDLRAERWANAQDEMSYQVTDRNPAQERKTNAEKRSH
jgi:hypothetical protein